MSSKFIWHGLGKQITKWAQSCVPCQRSKVHKHTKAPLSQFELPTRRFDHVHIDLVGPLPESQGHTYLLTMIDRFTRWPEAIPIQNIETRTVARAFIQNWVTRFGVPLSMTSDRGAQSWSFDENDIDDYSQRLLVNPKPCARTKIAFHTFTHSYQECVKSGRNVRQSQLS